MSRTAVVVVVLSLLSMPSRADEAAVRNAAKLSLLAKNGSVEGLTIMRTSHGALKAHLHGRFRHALVLRIAPDGSASIECVDSPEREAALVGVKPAEDSLKRNPAPEE